MGPPGVREAQLRPVANGYIRRALENAAVAWLLAASNTSVLHVDRELRAAARVITGCPAGTPSDPLMAEAGLPTAWTTRCVLAARMVCSALSLPTGDPLRQTAERPASACRPRDDAPWGGKSLYWLEPQPSRSKNVYMSP